MKDDDMALVRDYAANDSEAAFAALVSRHVNLVHSAALRQARDPHLAEEITQTVFIILARKARSLDEKTILPGWLYRTTNYVSRTALKIKHRRELREQEAYMQSMIDETNTASWEQLSPLLDAAMGQLRESDRDVLVLRFFQNKNFKEVGDALTLEESAARKRVERALEKLRVVLAKRGIVSTAVIIAGAISTHSVQAAPVTLAKTATTIALAKGATASGQTLTIIKGALKIMAWTKAKMAVAVGVGLLLAAGTATVAVKTYEAYAEPVFLGPPDPGTELGYSGWFHGSHGKGFVDIDTSDPATGHNDLTLGSTEAGEINRADWRSKKFELGSAADGKRPMTLSFAYKLLGTVAERENIAVHLRFFDAGGTNFIIERIVQVGSITGDSEMTTYKTKVTHNIRAPKGAKVADVRVMLNEPLHDWTSGNARFDDFSVVADSRWRTVDDPPNNPSAMKNDQTLYGIGAVLFLDEQTHNLLINSIAPGSPAEHAGLTKGLIIQKIDDVKVADKKLKECVDLVREEVGTHVTLEVFDPAKNETRTVELIREKLQTPAINLPSSP